ncbi:hypothetical protein PROFUN_10663 [Planoprotostelium fungivorum]|uniref:Uncharacterized protein n=1 Tax=Planoprotostelium fungivorum TaxID=1890364 RepID=A0A2P6MUU7_9EUKA|nr:hypothetical protein PROFUN_10663 [Planoprotostelium fungivorum]
MECSEIIEGHPPSRSFLVKVLQVREVLLLLPLFYDFQDSANDKTLQGKAQFLTGW